MEVTGAVCCDEQVMSDEWHAAMVASWRRSAFCGRQLAASVTLNHVIPAALFSFGGWLAHVRLERFGSAMHLVFHCAGPRAAVAAHWLPSESGADAWFRTMRNCDSHSTQYLARLPGLSMRSCNVRGVGDHVDYRPSNSGNVALKPWRRTWARAFHEYL